MITMHEPPPARKPIEALQAVAHGALDYSELERLGISPDQIIDFSTNTNPYGPPPGVEAALRQVVIDRYPDREALALRRALASHLDYPIEGILPGNGSAEIFWLIALAFLQPDDGVLILGPTFGEYARAAGLIGAKIDELRAEAEAAFSPDAALIQSALQQRPYRLVFICNPNNPTGQALPAETLAAWAEGFPNTLFVIDEAYHMFAGDEHVSVLGQKCANLLVVRSMTKDFALTGLRLGYAAGHAQVIGALRKVQPPWSVNALAQAAGVAALAGIEQVRSSLQLLRSGRMRLVSELQSRGFTPLPTTTQFFILNVGNAACFRASLLPAGVQVRDCASFGLAAYVRIAARTPEENQRLLAAMDEMHR